MLGKVFLSDFDCDTVKPQSFSFSRKRRAFQMKSTVKSTKVGPADYQSIAKLVLGYLDNSEALKVGTKELEKHAPAPNEPSVDIEHIVRHARGEKHKKCSRSSADKEQERSWSPVWRDGRSI